MYGLHCAGREREGEKGRGREEKLESGIDEKGVKEARKREEGTGIRGGNRGRD